MTVALGIVLGLVVAIVVGYPLYRPGVEVATGNGQQRELQSQKDALRARMQELDLDFERGSTPEEVYRELRRKYEQELGVLSESLPRHRERSAIRDEVMEQEIERQIRQLRQGRSEAPGADEPLK